jgi:Protein of unknown function (DUF3800)
MVALKGYFDESGKPDDPHHSDLACVLAGYITNQDVWEKAEREWVSALDSFGLSYMHMKEFAHSQKHTPFESWEGNEARRAALLKSLCSVIRNNNLVCFNCVLHLPGFRQFNKDCGQSLDPYAFAVHVIMQEVYDKYKDIPVEIVLDRFPKQYHKLAIAQRYAETDSLFPRCGHYIDVNGLGGAFSSKDVPALQMADFAAYEIQKSVTDKRDWYLDEMGNVEPGSWFASQFNWKVQRWMDETAQGKQKKKLNIPPERSSYLNLFMGQEVHGIMWTYDILQKFNEARSGVWV